jgi:hypothetical protein
VKWAPTVVVRVGFLWDLEAMMAFNLGRLLSQLSTDTLAAHVRAVSPQLAALAPMLFT